MGRTISAVHILHLILLYFLQFTAATQLALGAERHHKPGCSKRERDVLLSIKQRLTDPANLRSSWHGDDCCSWRGVGCDARTGHVVHLDLGRSMYYSDGLQSLSGDIDPSLANLTHLRYLVLSSNSVNLERFLPSIGSLTQLVYLNLSHIHSLTQLVYNFNLSHLHIPHSKLPQLGNLSSLRYLDFSSSESLEIDNLQWLSGLSSLQLLDLSEIRLDKVADWLTSINMVLTLAVLHPARSVSFLASRHLYRILLWPSYLLLTGLTAKLEQRRTIKYGQECRMTRVP